MKEPKKFMKVAYSVQTLACLLYIGIGLIGFQAYRGGVQELII